MQILYCFGLPTATYILNRKLSKCCDVTRLALYLQIFDIGGVEKMSTLSEAVSDFSLGLLKEVGSPGGNPFLSPFSISAALAMTYAGADGNTKKEMKDAIFWSTTIALRFCIILRLFFVRIDRF